MTEASQVWAGTVTGDAGPYTDDQWSDMYRALFQSDRTTQGIIDGHLNELVVTGATSPVAVDTGAALVDGKFYENDASLNVTIPSPAGATRIDRIVLRKSWSAQTVRITRIAGVEGGAAPAITQNDGVTWDVKLYQVSIAVGGAITLTDERVNCGTPLADLTAVNAHIAADAAVHGLPANAYVLGNKNATGEFVQHGTGVGTTSAGLVAYRETNPSVSFAVAFSATPGVLLGTKTTTASGNGRYFGGRSVSTTGFQLWCMGDNGVSQTGYYMAIGT